MKPDELARFQRLHQSVAKGEALSETDRSFYESALSALDAEEAREATRNRDSLTRRIESLEAELSFLQERRLALKARLDAVEPARAA